MSTINLKKMKDNNSLVPRLRFKEFSGEWEEKRLGELGKFIGGGTPSRSKLEYWMGEIPWISSSDVKENDIHAINISEYINEDGIKNSATKLIPKDSVLFVSRVGVGKVAVNREQLCTSQDFTNFIPGTISSYFVAYYYSARQEYLTLLSQGTSIKGFSKEDLENSIIYLPISTKEQQKIADTLSSLDTLIQSEQAKLTQLQEHKKGLMQNLFPQEGESVPKVRFKEFENDGEWAEKKIKSIGVVITGGTPNKSKGDYWDGEFIWTTAQDFKSKYIYTSVLKLSDEGKAKMRVIPINSVLVTCIASIGLNAINKVECATNQQINSIVCNPGFYFEFIYYVVESNISRLRDLAGQTAVPIINKRSFEEFVVQIPINKTEQQKIASTLSSLDDLISSQTKRIELLQQHKKGLMQGLFPSAQ